MVGNNRADRNAGANAGGADDKPKGFTYRCVTKCTYGGKLVREGEIIILDEKKDIPHFELVS
jgi:hypothetical protein